MISKKLVQKSFLFECTSLCCDLATWWLPPCFMEGLKLKEVDNREDMDFKKDYDDWIDQNL